MPRSTIAVPIIPTKRVPFVRNADLLREIALSRETGVPTDDLCRMMMKMIERLFGRGNYRRYSYVDELKDEALVAVLYAWSRFKAEKSNNPFSYLTTVMVNAANRILNKERRQREIRDALVMSVGGPPTFDQLMRNEESFKDDLK